LTPCCGLEVQKPTQSLKTVKDPGNTFDLNLKWARTIPSGIKKIIMGYSYRPHSRVSTLRRGLYKYPMQNILRTAKFLSII
jgi:hypothetical protein